MNNNHLTLTGPERKVIAVWDPARHLTPEGAVDWRVLTVDAGVVRWTAKDVANRLLSLGLISKERKVKT